MVATLTEAGTAAMSRVVSNRSQHRTEAQAFFAEIHPFPLASIAVGLIAVLDVAATVATLLAF
jgi:hypothetical protein